MADLAFTPTTKMLVDGELIDADDSSTFDNVNPATEEVLGQVPDAQYLETKIAAWPVQA
jgi:aldehyde dehydrogenase (NAD+)